MSNLLSGLANLQAVKSISPPIIDYDAQNRLLQVVDSTFYFLADAAVDVLGGRPSSRPDEPPQFGELVLWLLIKSGDTAVERGAHGEPFFTSLDVWAVGFPTIAGSPLDRPTSVDGLGALAGASPLALRFHDALLFEPAIDRPTNLLAFEHSVANLDGLQAF